MVLTCQFDADKPKEEKDSHGGSSKEGKQPKSRKGRGSKEEVTRPNATLILSFPGQLHNAMVHPNLLTGKKILKHDLSLTHNVSGHNQDADEGGDRRGEGIRERSGGRGKNWAGDDALGSQPD